MIKSFRCKETEKLFNRQRSKKLPQDIQTVDRLEQLSGDREGQYSIRINSQYRICFEWLNGDASNVEIVDYH